MQTDWPAEHGEALRHYLAAGMSFARAADAINARFKTCYSRSATIGRAKRMGLAGPDRLLDRPEPRPQSRPQASAPRLHIPRERYADELIRRLPIFEAEEPVELRRADIDPRHLSLLDLKAGDCRYPYGGDADGEAITFCGHPRRRSSSYCAAHCDLTRGPAFAPEPAGGAMTGVNTAVAIMTP
jgi:GcrA cell cycle regulator